VEQYLSSTSALSGGNPKSGLPDWRWRRYGILFSLEDITFGGVTGQRDGGPVAVGESVGTRDWRVVA
jgi:hypothetical protein